MVKIIDKGPVEERVKFVIDLVGNGHRYALDQDEFGNLLLIPIGSFSKEDFEHKIALCPPDLTAYITAQRIFAPIPDGFYWRN